MGHNKYVFQDFTLKFVRYPKTQKSSYNFNTYITRNVLHISFLCLQISLFFDQDKIMSEKALR